MLRNKEHKKVLFLSPYPENCAPSQRLKYEQYFTRLESRGFEVESSSFVSEDFWKILYQDGNFLLKAIYIIWGYLRRMRDILRMHKYDVVYVHLWVTPIGPPVFETLVRWRAKRLIYDIDDMIFLGHSSSANRFFQFLKGRTKMIELMKSSDHVITCTPKLDEFVKKYNLNTTDISSTINTHEYVPIEGKSINKEKITLGWSGSHSTSKYLHLLDDVIRRLSLEYEVELKVIGDKNFSIEGVQCNSIEWTEASEIQELQEIDIGLYPLPDEEWVLGKSGLKALQYMALGIPTVATAIGANFRVVNNGVTGILVEAYDDDAWYTAIKTLIEDEILYRKFSIEGRKQVLKSYSLDANIERYVSAIWRRVDVSILIPSLDKGGAEKVAAILANDLSKDQNVEIVLLTNVLNQEIGNGVTVKFLRRKSFGQILSKFIWIFIAARLYRRYLRKSQVRTSISFLNRPNFINVLASYRNKNIRTIINERSYPPEAYKKPGFVNFTTKFLIGVLYPKADKIISNSNLTKRYFEERFSKHHWKKLAVWTNPIILPESPIVRRGVAGKKPIKLLSVGRLDKNKNQKLIVDAMCHLPLGEFEFHIVGKGKEEEALVKHIKRCGMQEHVVLHSQVPDPSSFYKMADIFVLSSYFEGFPNVLLESMAYGLPVISTDCKSGPREIFNVGVDENIQTAHFTDLGVLIPLDNIAALKDGILKLVQDQDYYQKLSTKGYARLKEIKNFHESSFERVSVFKD